MRWMTHHLTLPILLGLSLTSISIAVLYILYKKDEKDTKSKKNNVEILKQFTVQCKVPRQFVPAVIGRCGSVIKHIQNKTGTQIHFKDDNIYCPNCICIIKGNYESVHSAEEMIKSIVQNQPINETYVMYVPQHTCGRIIGKGGKVISQIRTTTRAKIIIENNCNPYDTSVERMITIKGTSEQVAAALLQIKDKIREEEAHLKLETTSTSRMLRGKLSPRNTTISTSEQIQTTESLSLQVSDSLMEVYVSAMESPSQFCIQVVGPGTKALDKLVHEMTTYYDDEQNHELHILKNITFGQIVAVKFSSDKQWYRAEVISTPEHGYCEVYFVDYGDYEMVQINCVLELRTDFLNLRLQAVECSLANIKSRYPVWEEWCTEACNMFAKLTWLGQSKVLNAKVRGYKERTLSHRKFRREGPPIFCVDLFKKNEGKDINIGEEMVNEGYAMLQESLSSTVSSTLSPSTRSYELTTISSPASTSTLPKRALIPETVVNTLCKFGSTDSLNSNKSVIDLETSTSTPSDFQTEEIDLATPQRTGRQIEEIDPVTKYERRCSVENEKLKKARNPRSNTGAYLRIIPAACESDNSMDSDELELGPAIFRSFLSTGKSRNRADDEKKEGTKPSSSNDDSSGHSSESRTRKKRYRKFLHWNSE